MICRYCGVHIAALEQCPSCKREHPAVTVYRTRREDAVTAALTALLEVPELPAAAEEQKPVKPPAAPRRVYLLAVIAAAAVLVIGAGVFLLHRGSGDTPLPEETAPSTEAMIVTTEPEPTETSGTETAAAQEEETSDMDGDYSAVGHGEYVRSRSEWYSLFGVKPSYSDKTVTVQGDTLTYADTAYPCMYRHEQLILTDTNFAGISDDFIESFDFAELTGSDVSRRADSLDKRLYRFDLSEQGADVTLLCTMPSGLSYEEDAEAVWSISDGSRNAVVLTEEDGVYAPGISYRGKVTAMSGGSASVLLDTETAGVVRLSPDAQQDFYFYRDADSTQVYLIQFIRYNNSSSGGSE